VTILELEPRHPKVMLLANTLCPPLKYMQHRAPQMTGKQHPNSLLDIECPTNNTSYVSQSFFEMYPSVLKKAPAPAHSSTCCVT
jgi:hypothetical protein